MFKIKRITKVKLLCTHYADVCERAGIAKLLVEHGADIGIKVDDGNTPSDLRESSWPWMQPVAANGAD